MTTHEDIYIDLLDRIIENEKALYGELAVTIARNTGELLVSDKGKVLEIHNTPKKIIQDLSYEYGKLDGTISKNYIDSIVSIYKTLHPDLDLPLSSKN
ncbi:MAG TPA: hypothetical protein DCL35_07040 [Candidatus Omnitrophica bacterium]|nr:hypothetical protein [Candidatus Omnitrophota bacterium]